MAGGGAAQQNSNQDTSTSVFWGIFAIFAALGAVWYFFKKYLVIFYLVLKLYETKLMSFFSPEHFVSLQSAILAGIENPEQLNIHQVISLGDGVGDTLRFPLVVILIGLGLLVYFGHTTRIFRNTYSMQELAKLEKDNWPQITPVVNLNLIKTDIDTGPWAMAMTPMQFCKRYRLLEEVRPQRREGMSRKEWDKIDVLLKRGNANKIFALQLGPLWRGTDKLPPYTRALFAAFAARINADSKAAANLFSQLSASSSTKLDLTGVDELLKKHENTKQVQKIIQSHAYVLTVMAAMLEGARDDGVQASADFLWLKPVDRKLWYTLNTVGRQTPFIEVAGIFAQWVAEKEAGRRLLVPMVEEATKALEIALKDIIYRPDEA